MHEFAIAMNLVSGACEAAERAGGQRVTAVHCRIGDMRQIDHALIREAFDAAACDTRCDGAELVVERIPLLARCETCRESFAVRNWDWQCPRCGREGELLGGGDELELQSIEMETGDEYSDRAQTVGTK